MTAHVLQTHEAEVEARALLHITKNYIADKSGLVIVGLSKDMVTGMYLLS